MANVKPEDNPKVVLETLHFRGLPGSDNYGRVQGMLHWPWIIDMMSVQSLGKVI